MSVALGAASPWTPCVLLFTETHRDLGGNQLSGSIPDSIGNLAQLNTMCVGCCVVACVAELA